MPDISMCKGYADGKPCPAMGTCYRHKAKPNHNWQSYISNAPFIISGAVGLSCQYYIPMEKSDYEAANVKVRQLEAEVERLHAAIGSLGATLAELRARYHAAGRRPEECYEQALIDATLHGIVRGVADVAEDRT